MDFDTAFTTLLGHEGKYTNDPRDPGGETMWGITLAVARENGYAGPMRDMSTDVAKTIYRRKYWNVCQCDQLPELLRYVVFDAAVNSGTTQAAKWLQQVLGVQDDGIIGYVTLNIASHADVNVTYRKMLGKRLRFMTDLKTWDAFGKGWARRVAAQLEM